VQVCRLLTKVSVASLCATIYIHAPSLPPSFLQAHNKLKKPWVIPGRRDAGEGIGVMHRVTRYMKGIVKMCDKDYAMFIANNSKKFIDIFQLIKSVIFNRSNRQ
jgi:hypothetical protein